MSVDAGKRRLLRLAYNPARWNLRSVSPRFVARMAVLSVGDHKLSILDVNIADFRRHA
jgi:hypothetical protein